MLLDRLLMVAVLCVCAAPVRAISFDCVPPVFPARQVTQEELRRIDQQVRAWNACYAAFSATHRSIDATRQDHEVANELEKWSSSLRLAAPASGQRAEAVDRRKTVDLILRQGDQPAALYSRDRR